MPASIPANFPTPRAERPADTAQVPAKQSAERIPGESSPYAPAVPWTPIRTAQDITPRAALVRPYLVRLEERRKAEDARHALAVLAAIGEDL